MTARRVTNAELLLAIQKGALNGHANDLKELLDHKDGLITLAVHAGDLVKVVSYIPFVEHLAKDQADREGFGRVLRRLTAWNSGAKTMLKFAVSALLFAIAAFLVWKLWGGSTPTK